jgi:hypothetical protein
MEELWNFVCVFPQNAEGYKTKTGAEPGSGVMFDIGGDITASFLSAAEAFCIATASLHSFRSEIRYRLAHGHDFIKTDLGNRPPVLFRPAFGTPRQAY